MQVHVLPPDLGEMLFNRKQNIVADVNEMIWEHSQI